jgi:hypothetical protein
MDRANPVHTTTFAVFDFVVAVALGVAGTFIIFALLI